MIIVLRVKFVYGLWSVGIMVIESAGFSYVYLVGRTYMKRLKNKHRVLLPHESDVDEAARLCERLNIKETKWKQLDEFRNNMSSTTGTSPVRQGR